MSYIDNRDNNYLLLFLSIALFLYVVIGLLLLKLNFISFGLFYPILLIFLTFKVFEYPPILIILMILTFIFKSFSVEIPIFNKELNVNSIIYYHSFVYYIMLITSGKIKFKINRELGIIYLILGFFFLRVIINPSEIEYFIDFLQISIIVTIIYQILEISSINDIYIINNTIIITGVIISIIGILQFIGNNYFGYNIVFLYKHTGTYLFGDMILGSKVVRANSTFGANANAYGIFTASWYVLYLFRKKVLIDYNLQFIIVTSIALVSLFMSFSRSSIIILFLMIIIYLLVYSNKKYKIRIIVFSIILMPLITKFINEFVNFYSVLRDISYTSGHLYQNILAINIIKSNWLFGVGFNPNTPGTETTWLGIWLLFGIIPFLTFSYIVIKFLVKCILVIQNNINHNISFSAWYFIPIMYIAQGFTRVAIFDNMLWISIIIGSIIFQKEKEGLLIGSTS